MFTPVLMKLKRSTALSPRDELALQQVLGRYKVIPARQDVVWDGDRPAHATVLLDGLMCRYTAMPDGRRQILSFLLPGDFCDLSALMEDRMDHAVATLATCTVAAVEHHALEHVIDTHPSIRHALWRETLRDAAIYRASLASIGRRSAYERLAHLVVGSVEQLRAELFCEQPVIEAALVWEEDRAVGFALWFQSYSTFLARRGLWLEDLFVIPEARGKGYGKALLKHCAKLAVDRGCGRFEWSVLDWNEGAIRFYQRMGATVMPDWRICRIAGPALAAFAETPRG